MTDRREYDVGFGKPPKHTQFKKGQSGNPNGRPKGARNLKTDLVEELQMIIHVTDGSRKVSISKRRALLKVLFAKALKGNVPAINTTLSLIARLENTDTTEDNQPLNEEEAAILEQFKMDVLQEAQSKRLQTASASATVGDEKNDNVVE